MTLQTPMGRDDMVTTTEKQTAFLGHPVGLYALFGTEMWERLSYYGMRAFLTLYLTKAIGMSRDDTLALYGVYTALVYLTPLIGGRLADRYLGQRKAVFIGGILMAMGQFTLTQRPLLDLGLGLLILGNGFFKPNISTMVGGLYPQGDSRRDGAYTIFYMGINLGALLAPLICGPLGEYHGWWPGFLSAGIGMALGISTFAFTQRLLQGVGLPPGRESIPGSVLRPRDWVEIVVSVALCSTLVYGAIEAWPMLHPFWSPAGWPTALTVIYKGAILLGLIGLFLYLTEPRKSETHTEASEPLTGADWSRILVIFVISLFSIIFFMGFEQSGGTLNLFADEKTNRVIFGYEIAASEFQAVNPLFIIALAPVFAWFWTFLARRKVNLPSIAKQGIGLVLLGVAAGVMYLANEQANSGRVSSLWLIGVYLIFTIAELCLSPIGLSLVNRLAPAKLASLMMAVWFLCTAAGNYLAAMSEQLIKPLGWNLWIFLGVMAFVPGVLLLVLTPVLVRMSHGRD